MRFRCNMCKETQRVRREIGFAGCLVLQPRVEMRECQVEVSMLEEDLQQLDRVALAPYPGGPRQLGSAAFV